MIVGNILISTRIVDGQPYMTARNLGTGEESQKRIPKHLVDGDVKAKKPDPELDLMKKLECVTMAFTDGEEAAADKFNCSLEFVKGPMEKFEKGELA